MARYRIVIDRSLCSGFGSCVEHAPNVVRLERGVAVAAGETPDPAILGAATACPMGAIVVFDEATGEQLA